MSSNPKPWTVHLKERCNYCERINELDVIVSAVE
jgi:hypothetical protein